MSGFRSDVQEHHSICEYGTGGRLALAFIMGRESEASLDYRAENSPETVSTSKRQLLEALTESSHTHLKCFIIERELIASSTYLMTTVERWQQMRRI